MLSALFDVLFPPRCLNCTAYVERRGTFCPACMRRLIGVRAVACPREAADYLAGIWAFGHYREGLRDLLRGLKYQKRMAVLSTLHTILEEGEDVLAQLPRPLIAAAVPLAQERQRTRGFNQSEEIFAPWLAAHGVPLSALLKRTRETAPLYGQRRRERRRELRSAFAVTKGAAVAGKDILLVDDIMTTGTTLAECARTLKQAGAQRIYAFVLASEHP